MNRIIKKSFIVGMLCFLIAGYMNPLAVSAISKDGVYMEKVLKNYKNGKYKAAEKNAKKLHKNANEKCVKNMPKKMKQVYKKIVKTAKNKVEPNGFGAYINSYAGYLLTDIDNDKKADLIVVHGISGEADRSMTVYQYKNGSVKEVGTVNVGHTYLYAFPDHNGIVEDYAHMGYEQLSVISISKGKLKVKDYGGRDFNWESDGSYLSLGCDMNGSGYPKLD